MNIILYAFNHLFDVLIYQMSIPINHSNFHLMYQYQCAFVQINIILCGLMAHLFKLPILVTVNAGLIKQT